LESESLEVNARTVDDAIVKASQMLGRPKEDLQITVLSEGRGGILGIGAEDAHILVSVRPEVLAPVAPEPEIESEPEPVAEVAPGPARRGGRGRERRGEPSARSEAVAEDVAVAEAAGAGAGGRPPPAPVTAEVAEEARNILLDVLDLLGMDTDVEIQEREGTLVLEVIGEDLGLLIGRRGETLTSLQFVLNLILAKRLKKWSRVVVDVEGYRSRREATLSGLAQRMAFRVQQTGQAVALEAMPAGERRIIHMALADHPQVSTGSVGEGDHRKVVISPRR
jgi:spoIIIJ-associated protein